MSVQQFGQLTVPLLQAAFETMGFAGIEQPVAGIEVDLEYLGARMTQVVGEVAEKGPDGALQQQHAFSGKGRSHGAHGPSLPKGGGQLESLRSADSGLAGCPYDQDRSSTRIFLACLTI